MAQVVQLYAAAFQKHRVYSLTSTHQLSQVGKEFYIRWLKEVKKKNIVFHDILSYVSGEYAAPLMKEVLRRLYEFQLMPKNAEDFPTDILIWNDTVALLSLEKPVFGTIITSPALARTFTIFFTTMWGYLSK